MASAVCNPVAGSAVGIAETLDFEAKQYSLGDVIEPASIVVRDFNGDGILDVVTANFVSSDVSLLDGNRHGGSPRLQVSVSLSCRTRFPC